MKKVVCLFVILFSSVANAAIIQLADPSSLTLSNDFESSVNNADATFNTSFQALASSYTSSVTPSGSYGISNRSSSSPLVGTLSSPFTALGIWFGNDDFNNIFDATLEVFNGTASLGSVSVQSNGNDYADQFLGLSSTEAFDRFLITYQRPDAGLLYIYLDDLYLGNATNDPDIGGTAAVPEPPSIMLLGLGLAGIIASRRKKKLS